MFFKEYTAFVQQTWNVDSYFSMYYPFLSFRNTYDKTAEIKTKLQ